MEKLNNENLAPKPAIIGDAPEKVKNAISNAYGRNFYGEKIDVPGAYRDYLSEDLYGIESFEIPGERREMIKQLEREKKPQEIALIKAADDELNEIMARLKLPAFEIPEKNIHIIDEKQYEIMNGRRTAGFLDTKERFVAIPNSRSEDLVDFGAVAFHEMNHLKGYNALRVIKLEKIAEEEKMESELDKNLLSIIIKKLGFSREKAVVEPKTEKRPEYEINVHRAGLGLVRIKKDEKSGKTKIKGCFLGLEEAVVAEMEQEYRKKLLGSEIIKDAYKSSAVTKSIFAETSGYPAHKEVLRAIVLGIYEKNKEKFKSEKDVHDVFISAHFTGKLLPFSRLIRKTFGSEIFEKVVDMDRGSTSALELLDALNLMEVRNKIVA